MFSPHASGVVSSLRLVCNLQYMVVENVRDSTTWGVAPGHGFLFFLLLH